MSNTPLVECRGLVKRLPSGRKTLTILDGIDLRIPAGDFVAILGPSGSGKSTLLGLMALFPLELTGVEEARPRATEMLRRVGLADRGHHYPSQLSGGEQQRVALARAFAPGPGLLLADEPTGNLDQATGKEALDLLLDLREHAGVTLVLVTHDPQVAERAHRRIHLESGRLVREETAS
jgi:putative ABC transport system ATP-binding protein